MQSPVGEQSSASPVPRRRKVRKGTRSCWECKRRKVRCTFTSDSDAVCIPCRRRGASCVGQDVPEELVPSSKRDQRDRIERMEALLRNLGVDVNATHGAPERRSEGVSESTPGADFSQHSLDDSTDPSTLPTPGPSDAVPSPASQPAPPPPIVAPHGGWTAPSPAMRAEFAVSTQCSSADGYADKLQKLSKSLFAACPSLQDVQMFCTIFKECVCFGHQYTTRSLGDLELNGPETIDQLANMPSPKSHPVLIARWMLSFALLLQQALPLDGVQLSECPWRLITRLKDTATALVSTNEELFGTLESLECILLESAYENCRGHFRRAWLGVRRAMTAAQLMNLHRAHPSLLERLDPNTRTDPQFLWFKIVYMDRALCLMLGLPAASIDIELPNKPSEMSPLCNLQRIHAIASKKILERNDSKPSDGYPMTESIDAQLLEAAEQLPHHFWQPPDLSACQRANVSFFWETIRLVEQMGHFNLLNHLHLPYLLCFDEISASSKVTCAHASREILSRWTAYRSHFTLSFCCRIGDFIALRAGLALCLAHLTNHHNAKPSLPLRHQRLGDRSLIEKLMELMHILIEKAHDPLAKESSELLQRLLDFEGNAAKGQVYSAEKSSHGGGIEGFDGTVLSIVIPYFGTVKISPKGVISRENLLTPPSTVIARDPTVGIQNLSGPSPIRNSAFGGLDGIPGVASTSFTFARPDNLLREPSSVALGSNAYERPQPQSTPFSIAGVDDWPSQGVDTAFFDSLMRGICDETMV